jgi:hypothetical protein
MSTVLMSLRAVSEAPTLEELKKRFGLENGEIDSEFGVVEVAPGEFSFLVEEAAAEKCVSSGDWEVRGPFSNPRIAPFGPPEPSSPRGD